MSERSEIRNISRIAGSKGICFRSGTVPASGRFQNGCLENNPEIKRRVTPREYEKVIDYAIELGIQNAFIQEGETSKESFIPDFDNGVYLDEI